MDEPRADRRVDPDERSPPDFEALTPVDEAVRGGRTRDDFLDAVLGLDSPTSVDEVADLAGHGPDAAREYLQWFERMGIVRRVTESPARYECNREYLTWRRVQELREGYATEELLEFLERASERDEAYRESFDAESPAGVSISDHASRTDQTVAAAWEELSRWKTTRRRIDLLERALLADSEGTVDQRRAV